MSIRIAALIVCELLLIALLRQYKPEFVVVSEVACGILIGVLTLQEFLTVKTAFQSLLEAAGIGTQTVSVLLKVLGATLVTQFAADIARDHGERALSGQIEFAGRVLALSLSLPLFKALAQLVASLSERI